MLARSTASRLTWLGSLAWLCAACGLYDNVDYVPGAGGDTVADTMGTGGTGPGTGGPGTDSGGDTDGPQYAFDESPADDFDEPIDRQGMPAINTAVIDDKEAYNAATPEDDVDGDFVEEITASLEALHDALDDDLEGLDLTPCAAADCVEQAAPLVVPDTIKIDITEDAGFPNGRLLEEPVMDVTLAVVLLDLSVDGQEVTTFADLPLNPDSNDVDFLDEFPYLAPPN